MVARKKLGRPCDAIENIIITRPKQCQRAALPMVRKVLGRCRLRVKTEVATLERHFRFTPVNGHRQAAVACPKRAHITLTSFRIAGTCRWCRTCWIPDRTRSASPMALGYAGDRIGSRSCRRARRRNRSASIPGGLRGLRALT
jgi:hypothetical protein